MHLLWLLCCVCCAGGGRALMLACLSPLKAHAEESLNTLHFASMALRIKSQPVIMMDPQVQGCACDTYITSVKRIQASLLNSCMWNVALVVHNWCA
jgi:hypothetical protein